MPPSRPAIVDRPAVPRWTWLGLVVSATALGSCTDSLGPDVDYIEVSVVLSQSEMSIGDTTEIHVIAHNSTERTLTFRTNACVLGVRLLDRTGYPVFQDPTTCNDIGLQHELAPNESLVETFLFDGSTTWGPFVDETGNQARVFLAPGTYQVIGGIAAGMLNPSSPVELRIRSSS